MLPRAGEAARGPAQEPAHFIIRGLRAVAIPMTNVIKRSRRVQADEVIDQRSALLASIGIGDRHRDDELRQIGRASCRERV